MFSSGQGENTSLEYSLADQYIDEDDVISML